MAKNGESRKRRFKALLGLAAIGGFLLALPAAALACVSAGACTAGGGVVSPGVPSSTCAGGSQSGQSICTGGPIAGSLAPTKASVEEPSNQEIGRAIISLVTGADDPYLDISSTRDKGAGITSASATVSGPAQSSRTTDINGGVDGHISQTKVFDLAANQRLTIGGFFYYDSQHISYGSPTTIAAASSANRNIYTLGGQFRYDAGNTYFGGGVGGELGSGDLNGPGDTGSFDSRGYATAAYIGRVFSLWDTTGSIYAPTSRHTKAPQKPISGYAVNLDVSAHLGYSNDEIGGFTDSTGFVRGTERLAFWDVGGVAKLFWVLPPWGRVAWSPFVAATIDQEFGYSHTLDIPTQTAQAADTLYYGNAQTFGGAQIGIDGLDVSGVRFGVKGYYQQSSEFQVFGGQAYVKFPVLTWLGVQPVMPRN